MNFSKSILATAAMGTMVGCASAPPPKSDAEIASAYYGRAPSQQECQNVARRGIGSLLKDPYSAQYRFTDCTKNYLNVYGRYYYGYHIGGLVNGKNSYGGYVGETRFDVVIQDGVIIAQCLEEAGREKGCNMPYDWQTVSAYAK